MAIQDYRTAGRTTKLWLRHICLESIMDSFERFLDILIQGFLTMVISNSLLKIHLKREFDEGGGVSTILAMSITNSKEMEGRTILNVRCKHETVLVNFIGIVRLIPDSCRESKFFHYILSLQLLFRSLKFWFCCLLIRRWHIGFCLLTAFFVTSSKEDRFQLVKPIFRIRSGLYLSFTFLNLSLFLFRLFDCLLRFFFISWRILHCHWICFAFISFVFRFSCNSNDCLESSFLGFACIDANVRAGNLNGSLHFDWVKNSVCGYATFDCISVLYRVPVFLTIHRLLVASNEWLDKVVLVALRQHVQLPCWFDIFRWRLGSYLLRRCVRVAQWLNLILSKDFTSSLLRLCWLPTTALFPIYTYRTLSSTFSCITTVQLENLFIIIVATVFSFELIAWIIHRLWNFVKAGCSIAANCFLVQLVTVYHIWVDSIRVRWSSTCVWSLLLF